MFELDKQQFGTFIAKLRKEKGYTQKELASYLFLSDKAISKWETGVSIPDTALLIPLAERLDVTVTELLMCRRAEPTIPVDEVENVVKTAISFSDEKPLRAYQIQTLWHLLYVVALVISGIELLLHTLCRWPINEALLTMTILSLVFGAYFCFFAKMKLPAYFDEYKISVVSDGPFRMNLPGVYFNNSNWPHIIKVGCFWSCLSMVLFPLISCLNGWLHLFQQYTPIYFAFLCLYLAGLFVPTYLVGRKYQ